MAESPPARLGRYEIVELVGVGPKLKVYRARLYGVEGFAKDVALKIPRAEIAADERAAKALLRGARRAIGLTHASLLQLVDVARAEDDGKAPPVTYLVTEIARGASLAAVRAALESAATKASAGAVLSVLAEVARALDYVHRRRDDEGPLHHGALHEGQIFVTPEGQVKVADACLSPSRDPDSAQEDLAALGALLAAWLPLADGDTALATALADRLRRRQVPDAASAHEALLELAFAASAGPDDREPGALARVVAAPAPRPALDLDAAMSATSAAPASLLGSERAALLFAQPLGARTDPLPPEGAVVPTSEIDVELVALGPELPEGAGEIGAARLALSQARKAVGAPCLLTSAVVSFDEARRPLRSEATDAVARRFVALRDRGDLAGRVVVEGALVGALEASFVLEAAAGDLVLVVGDRGAAGARGRFVGRTLELRALGAAIGRAVAGGVRAVALRGPAGIGKTRLLLELARRVPKDRVAFIHVDCVEPASQRSLGALALIVRAALGLAPHERLDGFDVVRRLRASGLDGPDVASVCRVLGVPASGVSRPSAAHGAVGHLLAASAAGRPMVVVIDHADALDAATASALSALSDAPFARALPVLILLARRFDIVGPLSDAEELPLGELDDDAVAQLLATRLGARMIPPDLFELIVGAAGGHPELLEEVVRRLQSAALVSVKDGVAELAGELPAGELASASTGLASRVPRLPDEVRAVLGALATLRRAASVEELALVTGLVAPVVAGAVDAILREGLGRLDERGFVSVARSVSELALTRLDDASTRALSARAAACELAAAAAEEVDHEARAAHLASAATLQLAAGDAAGASSSWCASAEQLERLGAIDAAAELVGRSLGSTTEPEVAERAVELLARVASSVDLRRVELAEALAGALAVLDAAAPAPRRAELRRRLVRPFAARGLVELADVLCDQAASDDPGLASAVARLAIAFESADPERGRAALAELEELAKDAAGLTAEALLDAAAVACECGEPEVAGRWLERLEPDGSRSARAELVRGEIALAQRDAPAAERRFERALELGRAELEGRTAGRAAWLLAGLVGPPRAHALLREAQDFAREAGDASTGELAEAFLDALEGDLAAVERVRRRQKRAAADGRLRDAAAFAALAHELEGRVSTISTAAPGPVSASVQTS